MVQLVEFFEEHYGIAIDPREIWYPGGRYQSRLSFWLGDLIARNPTGAELRLQTTVNYQA